MSKLRRFPYIVYIIYIICFPLLPILDVLYMNIGGALDGTVFEQIGKFFDELASLGIVKDVAIYLLIAILIFAGLIMSFVFLAKKNTPDDTELKKLAKLNLITQIINTIVVTILSVFSVLCLLTVFTFAISFVIWIVLACLAISGGIQTLPLFNYLRRTGRIGKGKQAVLSIMGGFFYTALVSAIIAYVIIKKEHKDSSKCD